jgi:hypothetical protein
VNQGGLLLDPAVFASLTEEVVVQI